MTKNTPSGAKKHREGTEPESHQTAKMFSFFFFFFFFRWASSNLRDSFTMVFAQNSSIFTEQCTSPSLFSRFEVTRGNSNRSLKNYGFLYDAIFLHMIVQERTSRFLVGHRPPCVYHLSTWRNRTWRNLPLPGLPPSVFAYCKRSNAGGGNGLGTRLFRDTIYLLIYRGSKRSY